WIVLFVLDASAQALKAFPITNVAFHGNVHLASERLLDALSTDDQSIFKRDIANRSELLLAVERGTQDIQNTYTSEGYLYARIDSFQIALTIPTDSAQGYRLTFFISEGEQFKIANIEIRGMSQFAEPELLGRMVTRPGTILNEQTLARDIDGILALYEEHGYPLAKISIESITPHVDSQDHGLLAINLQLWEGPRAKIGKVVIAGNEATNPNVILRELALQSGMFYNAEALSAARARVERLGFFESVSEPELYLEKDSTVIILLRGKEASTSAIDGVLGYNPPQNSSESGYLSGLIDLSLRNISGTGRNA